MESKRAKRSEAIEALLATESIRKMRRRILRPDNITGALTGSKGTFETYLQRLKRFLEWAKLGPDEFVQKVEDGSAYPPEMLNEFFDDRGGAPKSLKVYAAAIKKFLRINLSRGAKRSIDWEDVELPKMQTVETDKAPTKEVIKATLSESRGLQDRVVPLIAASSGMRVGSIAGLTVGEVDLEGFSDVGVVRVKPDIAKGKVGYVTFISPEAKTALIEYLEQRRRKGEEIGVDSPLICTRSRRFYAKSSTLTYRWTQMLERAGLGEKKRRHRTYHFHTLRKFFRTRLEAAGVSKSFRERLLGHSGEYLDASYFDPAFEELLAAYRSGIGELTIYSLEVIGEERIGTLEEDLEETRGKLEHTEERLEKFMRYSVDQLKRRLEDGGIDTSKTPHELAVEMGIVEARPEQRVIDEEGLVAHLSGGWRFVAQLNNGSGKIVVEK